jgi:hypothetical protein
MFPALFIMSCHAVWSTIAFFVTMTTGSGFSLLGLYIVQTEALCYAWVLMDNHYHLVLRLDDKELGRIMKPLNTPYAHYHRKNVDDLNVYPWSGHVALTGANGKMQSPLK